MRWLLPLRIPPARRLPLFSKCASTHPPLTSTEPPAPLDWKKSITCCRWMGVLLSLPLTGIVPSDGDETVPVT